MTIFERALRFAALAHGSAVRKVGGTPYILHPMEAAVIASTMTNDMEVISAAVLHDTIEDTATTQEDIRNEFGDRITYYVLSETEEKFPERPAAETWRYRKETSLRMLKEADDINVKILWLSDKLSNMRSFYRQYREIGDALWNYFNQKDKKQHEWYYRTIAENLQELKDTAALEEYESLIERIFGKEE